MGRITVPGNGGNAQNKYQIRLSEDAFGVLTLDRRIFFPDRNEGWFFNKIIGEFAERADASLGIRVRERQSHYREILSAGAGRIPESTLDAVVSCLGDHCREMLLAGTSAGDTGITVRFRLNDENLRHIESRNIWIRSGREILRSPLAPGEADPEEKPARKFLAELLEEYASKSDYEREEILFGGTLREIGKAMREGKRLRIDMADGTQYAVRPYGVLPDPNRLYHYLVGRSVSYEAGGIFQGEERVASIRISNITRVRTTTYGPAKLTAAERREIGQMITQRGLEFLLGETVPVKVRLTDEGMRTCRTLTHNRPRCESVVREKDGSCVCIFRCTEFRAEVYFFQFGSDAVILSPEDLRDRMIRRYEAGLRRYE